MPTTGVEWVARHLVERGLVDSDAKLEIAELTGGVSAEVFDVRSATGSLVVKRALPRLRVAQPWLADPRRIVRERDALEVAGGLAPGRVPGVIDFDAEAAILVIERAPTHWREWRADLFEGRCDPRVAADVGVALAAWHRRTTDLDQFRGRFGDREVFVQLRLDPFHAAVAAAHPRLAGRVDAVAERLASVETCMVHGDLSPKNVLQADDGTWVLDWEVAHLGDPVFDLAFLVTHLALKSIHRPAHADRYRSLATGFLAVYQTAGGPARRDTALCEQVGCLLLARVDGKSPAGYLTAAEREVTRELGIRLLSAPPSDVTELWELTP